MNAALLLHPRIDDPAGFQDFRDGLTDAAPRIERMVAELKRGTDNRATVADLFRAFHNLKGDASLCRMAFVVPLVHPIESLLERLRASEIEFSSLLGEVILLALDRLELTIEALEDGRGTESLNLPALAQGLDGLVGLPAASIDAAASRLIESVTGFRPAAVNLPNRARAAAQRDALERNQDLRFFRSLALQFEARSSLFRGRTSRNLRMALDTNTAAGGRVDPVQLEAAVYMHDVGMMFLPEPLWLKVGKLTEDERRQLSAHPGWAAELLARMEGWQEAARIVLQHQEMPDGRGYPNGLTSEAICDGAKILALVDAFEAVMLKHRHRGQQRSVLRAIAEVNASDRQFDPTWIEPFNRVVRGMLDQG